MTDETPEPAAPSASWMTSRWIAPAALAVAVAALGLSAVQTFGFDARVRAYLLANPEILIEMDSALKTHEAERAAAAVNANAAANPGLLAVDRRDPSFGPANAKVTVIEFFDYRCPGCKSVAPEVLALMQAHPDVRFVFKDWPILDSAQNRTSEYAARAALAAHQQGKYLPVYQALLAEPALTEESVNRILMENGVALSAALAAMESPEMTQHLTDIHRVGRTLQLIGTPTFFINGRATASIAPAEVNAAIEAAKKG